MKKLVEGLRGKLILIGVVATVISLFATFTIFAQREDVTGEETQEVEDVIVVEGETTEGSEEADIVEEEIEGIEGTTSEEDTRATEDFNEATETNENRSENEEQELPAEPVVESNQPSNENRQNNGIEKEQPAEEKIEVPVTENQSSDTERAMNIDLNPYVLDVIKTYQIGRYPYLLNEDYNNYNGVTVNLHYQNRLLLRAHPSGNRASHCSGITFEVFFKAMQQRNKEAGISIDDFNGMNYDQLFDFVLTWYVANGNKNISNIATAMERYGVGRRITNFEDAKAGDFLDFSRENNTGHTVVFLNWIRDNGRIVGLRYWGSQGSTNVINYKEEYFNVRRNDGSKYGNLIMDQVYIGRVSPINQYR